MERMATSKTTVQILMPAMGESVTEGVVLGWRKQVGEPVAADEPLVEISTDKVDADVPAPAAGVLARILVDVDETVEVGATLGEIETGTPPGAPGGDPAAPTPVDGSGEQAADGDRRTAAAPNGGNGDANATPVAARMAARHGLDLGQLSGSGPRGRVTKEDVEAAVADGAPAASGNGDGAPAGAHVTPIRGPAATLARLMDESRAIPTATSFRTLPVDSLDAHRKELKAAGRKLSFTHLIAWAIVRAAKDMPVMAHSFAEVDGKPQRVTPGAVSLGLAVLRAPTE